MQALPLSDASSWRSIVAPGGRLRAAINLGNAVLAQRAADGTLGGMSVRLATEAARRLELPLDLVPFDAAGKVTDAVARDEWDVAFLAVDPVRAEQIAFTSPYVVIQGSYLVRQEAPHRSVADIDSAGLRVVASRGSAYELHLRRHLRRASLVSPDSPELSFGEFMSAGHDALAGVRPMLQRFAGRVPGLRVLPDAFLDIRQAVALPRRAASALPWFEAFVADVKRSGFVAEGLRATGQADAAVAD